MLVLVIDDNPDDRALVVHELTSVFPQAQVREIVDARDLDDALEGSSPALTVTDLDLRWTSGLDVLKRLKEKHPDCPVIMFTGTGDEEAAVEAMKAGLDDYIVKSPRQLPRLRASIHNVVTNAARGYRLRETERHLREALAHKDLILRELHHRVKNNLQTAISLVNLRARRHADPAVRRDLEEVASRLASLAQVQNRIYASEDLNRVDFGGYLADIAETLTTMHGGAHAALNLELEGPLTLPIERATPLGLLCYEIMLNSLKHGFPEHRKGSLVVRLELPAHGPEIVIADDGVGFDQEAARPGMGSALIHGLAVQANVDVTTETEPGGGTRTIIRLET